MLKFKINFYINNSEDDAESPIRVLVSYNSKRPPLYSGISAKPSEWDKEIQRFIDRKNPKNKEIDDIESLITDIFKEFEIIEKRFPTPEEFKLKFTQKNWKDKRNRG